MLFTLDDTNTISISRLFYRDQQNPPSSDSSVDPTTIDADTVVMELILALVLLATPAPDPDALWVDLAPVRQAVRSKRRFDGESGGYSTRSAKRSSKSQNNGQQNAGTTTLLSLAVASDVFTSTDEGNYLCLPPSGLVRATLEQPISEPELIGHVVDLGRDDASPDSSFSSDHSLTWSTASEPSSDDTSIELYLKEFLGRGRTWDAFEATLAARLPGGDVSRVPAVVKHVELTSLERLEEAQAGYPELGRVMRAVDREAAILRSLDAVAPGIAPRLYALWTAVADDHILLTTEDCGDALTTDPSSLSADTKREIVTLYERVHAVGFVHGDVCWRHLTRDRKGNIRVLDWEGASEVDTDTEAGRIAVQEEMAAVYNMLGLDARDAPFTNYDL